MRCQNNISRFTRLKIAVLFTGSFQAVPFFLLTPAEKRTFSQLNAVISADVSKKKNRNFETCKPANNVLEQSYLNLFGLVHPYEKVLNVIYPLKEILKFLQMFLSLQCD